MTITPLTRTPTDPVFLAKRDLRVGSHLRYWGRTDPGKSWFVMKIWTEDRHGHGQHVTFPRTMKDRVTLRCHATGAETELRFDYLSYSAIWRIE